MENFLPFANLDEEERGLRRLEADPTFRLWPYLNKENKDLVYFTASTRETAFDWIAGVHRFMTLTDLTLLRAMRYADMFLSKRGSEVFVGGLPSSTKAPPMSKLPERSVLHLKEDSADLPSKLKRLMLTCLFVASKIEEVCLPKACAFVNAGAVVAFTERSLRLAEQVVLVELDYRLHYPTALCFAHIYINDLVPDMGERWDMYQKLVALLLETVALAHESLQFLPSLLAASAITVVGAGMFNVPRDTMAAKFASAAHSPTDLYEACNLFEKIVYDLQRSVCLSKPLNAASKYLDMD